MLKQAPTAAVSWVWTLQSGRSPCLHGRLYHVIHLWLLRLARPLSELDVLHSFLPCLQGANLCKATVVWALGKNADRCSLVQVLRQDQDFDALQWFDSVRMHFTAERARLKVRASTPV